MKQLNPIMISGKEVLPLIEGGKEVSDYRREFVETLKSVGLPIVTERDANLGSPVLELLDTGSTGRGTNKVSDYDFDSHMELVPMQPGDVPVTYADTTALEHDFGFKPQTSLREGLRKFAVWYKAFYC